MSDHTTTGSISPFDYDGAVAMLATLTEERDAALARASGAEAAAADLKARVARLETSANYLSNRVGQLKTERDAAIAVVNVVEWQMVGKAHPREFATAVIAAYGRYIAVTCDETAAPATTAGEGVADKPEHPRRWHYGVAS